MVRVCHGVIPNHRERAATTQSALRHQGRATTKEKCAGSDMKAKGKKTHMSLVPEEDPDPHTCFPVLGRKLDLVKFLFSDALDEHADRPGSSPSSSARVQICT